MGLIFIICGLSCALFRTPQATTASVIVSTLIGKILDFRPVRESPVVSPWIISKACFDIIMILYCIFNEKERLEIIWKTRVNAFGLWSILICFVVAVMELILGLSARAQRLLTDCHFSNSHRMSGEPWEAFTAILHYDDVVERLQLHKTLVELAERYPLYYG